MNDAPPNSPIAPWLSQDPTIWQPHPDILRLAERPDVALYYDADYRTIGVWNIRDWETPRKYMMGFRFFYCPFGGRRLPGGLSGAMHDVLGKQFTPEIATHMWMYPSKRPRAFRSDKWWRDRRISLRTGREYHCTKIRKEAAIRLLEGPPLTWMDADNDRFPSGYRRKACKPPHLCPDLADTLSEQGAMFWYVPEDREYGPRILDPSQSVHDQPVEVAAVPHCPWCGKKLPPSLKAPRLRRLEALGLSPDDPDLPETRRTDQWWREEGLWPDKLPKEGMF